MKTMKHNEVWLLKKYWRHLELDLICIARPIQIAYTDVHTVKICPVGYISAQYGIYLSDHVMSHLKNLIIYITRESES